MLTSFEASECESSTFRISYHPDRDIAGEKHLFALLVRASSGVTTMNPHAFTKIPAEDDPVIQY